MSIKYTGKLSSFESLFIIKGFDHNQIPLVHGFIVGPTSKPEVILSLLFIITLFNKNDFPVRYFPTKLIIPIFLFSGFDIIFLASLLIINFFVDSLYVINGIAKF